MTSKYLNDSTFRKLLDSAEDITQRFDVDFGGLPEDVLKATQGVKPYINRIRDEMENSRLDVGVNLSHVDFGLIDMAEWTRQIGDDTRTDLENAQVIAIDGTPLIHPQRFLTGQVYACAIGGITSQTPMNLEAKLIKVQANLDGDPEDIDEVIRILNESEQLNANRSWSSVFLDYQERELAFKTPHKAVIVDGNLITQQLMTRREGRQLFTKMLASTGNKKYVGIAKNILLGDIEKRYYARALKSGELYIQETLQQFLKSRLANAYERNKSIQEFAETIGVNILRGVYKPGIKAFGFECHRDHLPYIVALLWLDRNRHPGFEIPFLLAQVDAQLRGRYRPSDTMLAIESHLASVGEDELFDELDERNLR